MSQHYQLSTSAAKLEAARAGDILFYRQTDLPPGKYTVEAVAYDAGAGAASVKSFPLEVPGPDAAGNSLSSLVVIDHVEKVPAADRDPKNPLYMGELLVYPSMGEPVRKAGQGHGLLLHRARARRERARPCSRSCGRPGDQQADAQPRGTGRRGPRPARRRPAPRDARARRYELRLSAARRRPADLARCSRVHGRGVAATIPGCVAPAGVRPRPLLPTGTRPTMRPSALPAPRPAAPHPRRSRRHAQEHAPHLQQAGRGGHRRRGGHGQGRQPRHRLAREDFTILDEGVPQPLVNFDVVDRRRTSRRRRGHAPPPSRPRIATNPHPASPGARSSSSSTTSTCLPLNAQRAKAAVVAFLDKGLRDGDRVMIAATAGGAWWTTTMPEGREDLIASSRASRAAAP